MKRQLILTCSLLAGMLVANAQQQSNTSRFELGSGLNLSYDNGNYTFKLGGMIQPYFGVDNQPDQDPAYALYVKRTFFSLEGKAAKEKVNFFLQMDFSNQRPLLDAWVNYNAFKGFNISAGQKLNPANNREMNFMETKLQFPDRSLLSQSFSNTGREFGVFLSYEFSLGGLGFRPQISATSGDGRNAFGVDSRDVDLGGFKYGFRFDFLPFGMFADGNENQFADLEKEQKPKLALGVAGSYNDGANEAVGEGHNLMELYNGIGQLQFPDYRKLSFDLLFKYKGFSLLGEYMVGTATSLDGLYLDNTGTNILLPTVISQYLNLGNSYALHAGYVSKWNIGLDLRYAAVTPEFGDNTSSLLADANRLEIGLSKYMMKNAMKLQVSYAQTEMNTQKSSMLGLLAQLWF